MKKAVYAAGSNTDTVTCSTAVLMGHFVWYPRTVSLVKERGMNSEEKKAKQVIAEGMKRERGEDIP